MKKITALVSVIMLIVSSCTTTDSNPDINQKILLKKIITKNLNNNSVINITDFEYNGNKISKSLSQNNKILYTYDAHLITNIKIFDLSNTLIAEYLFNYENNNLIESIYKTLSSNVCEKRLYTYNINGTVSFT